MITLKQQVINLMKDGFNAKEIYLRLKPMNPTTTLNSVSVEVSKQKKINAEKATNEQAETNQSN